VSEFAHRKGYSTTLTTRPRRTLTGKKMDARMNTIIVADIGGTNARFALAHRAKLGSAQGLSHTREFSTADFNTFAECLSQYLDDLNWDDLNQNQHIQRPTAACFAVAGPVGQTVTELTNVQWSLCPQALRRDYGLDQVEVVNDFAALASAIPYLSAEDVIVLQAGSEAYTAEKHAVKAVVGPGTGLGVAALMKQDNSWAPLASEGGHRCFAPETDVELALYQVLRDENNYAGAEQFLSGSGLQNIYQGLHQVYDKPLKVRLPHEITADATSGRCELAQQALSIFCAQLGSICGDTALTFGARAGLYLGGGIPPKIQEFLINSDFLQRFNNKGKQSEYVKNIAVKLIIKDTPALLGAAAWLINKN